MATLECGPDGGTHPTPQRACESLRAVDGRFPKLPQLPAGCPRVYDPVRVVAKGRWEGHDVTFTDTHSNRCVAAAHTDNVFDF